MRRKIENSHVLVTGASSGIGREIALQLARRGAHLLVTARREERLRELVDEIEGEGGTAMLFAGDITSPADREELISVAKESWGGLDVLVNNAGVGSIGSFMNSTPERLRQIFDLNFFAAVELMRITIPLLKLGNRPMIANVGSVLGHRAVPNKSEYCASKFALHGFSDALRAELVPQGIDVLLISPSTTSSEFWENVLANDSKLPWKNLGAMKPEQVAKKSVRAIAKGRHEVIFTPGGKMLVWFDRLCPPLMNRLIAHFSREPEDEA